MGNNVPVSVPCGQDRDKGRSTLTTGEQVKRRFCSNGGAEDGTSMTSMRLIMGFLSTARADHYINHDEYEELSKAVVEIEISNFGKQADGENDGSPARKEAVKMGFAKRKTSFDPGSPKTRGGESVIEGSVIPRVLDGGLDAEIVLNDLDLDCQSRSNVKESSAVILYGFANPMNYLGRYFIDRSKLQCWLEAIGSQYQSPRYHNYMHAFDVFQMCYLTLVRGGLVNFFNHQDACSMLIAAIAHDVGHSGVNNAFHVKAQTQLSVTYNDKSPMENMHASLAFETMNDDRCSFLERLNSDDYANMRTKIVDAILFTDPSHHFEYVGKLSARVKDAAKGPIIPLKEVNDENRESNKDDRRLLLQGFVHLADIANGLRPWDVYKKLVVALEDEFFAQGDQERELGVPIAPMMDREKDTLAAGQGFFLGMLVLPLLELYRPLMSNAELGSLFVDNLGSNKQKWADLVEKHGKKPAGVIIELEDG